MDIPIFRYFIYHLQSFGICYKRLWIAIRKIIGKMEVYGMIDVTPFLERYSTFLYSNQGLHNGGQNIYNVLMRAPLRNENPKQVY